MTEIFELSHFIPIVMVWLGVGILCLYKYIDYITHKPLVYKTTVKHKKDERIRTLVTAIFSNPDKNFELYKKDRNQKDNIITLQLLHRINDTIIQFLELKRDFREADIRTDCFGHQLLKILFIVYDKKKLPFVTRVKVSHESPNSTIFFEGIEIFEYYSNRRIYYLVKEPIRGGFPIEDADIHYIKPQVLRLWSKHTFCMSYEKPLIHEFGEELNPIHNRETSIKAYGDVNGVIIRSEIGWFESVAFYSLLFCSTFLAFVSILFIKYEDYLTINEMIARVLFAAIFSGFFSQFIAELMAICFLRYIKSMYEKNVSKAAKEASKRNIMFRFAQLALNFFIGVIVLLALICSGLSYFELYYIENKTSTSITDKYNVNIFGIHSVDGTIFLVIMYLISILLTLTLWIFIFGLLRYLFYYLTFTPKTLIIKDQISDQIIVENENNNQSNEALSHSEGKSIKRTKEELRISSKRSALEIEGQTSTPKTKSPVGSPKSPKNVKKNTILGTDVLEKEMADEKRKKHLMTKSVIHPSTKSKGFLSPEEFRATDSND